MLMQALTPWKQISWRASIHYVVEMLQGLPLIVL